VTGYEWDSRNRLTKVTEKNSAGRAATKIVTCQYHAFDRRTGKLLDWLSQDPVGFLAGDVNWYRYVGNEKSQFTSFTACPVVGVSPMLQ